MSSRPPSRRAGRGPRGPRRRSSSAWFFVGGIAVVAVIGIAAIVASRGGGDDGDDDAAGSAEVAASVSVDGQALSPYQSGGSDPAVGQAAPVATGADFTGVPVTVGGSAGTPQLLVFLAHWCPHCQAELPRIVDLAGSGGFPSDLELVAVATGTATGRDNYPPSEWLEREGWPGSILVDTANTTVANAYGLSSFPFFVLLDAQGRVVERVSGELTETQLRALATAGSESSGSGSGTDEPGADTEEEGPATEYSPG